MTVVHLFWVIVASTLAAFSLGRVTVLRRAEATGQPLACLPNYYGYLASWIVAVPALLILVISIAIAPLINLPTLAGYTVFALVTGLFVWAWWIIRPGLDARQLVERCVTLGLGFCSFIAVLTTFSIILSLVFESLQFFQFVSPLEFVTGLKWSPLTAIRDDQFGQTGAFGALPVFTGTLLITVIALLIAAPLGLMTAIYMSEFSSRRTRNFLKPTIEVLAAVPAIVYGYFALLIVGPTLTNWFGHIGLDVPSQSALSAGCVLGIMIVPYISSLSDDVISSVPQSLRDGSYALGATRVETLLGVVLPKASPGLFAAFLLATSRAIGETMIVVLAAGHIARLTGNPLDAVTTVTDQIVTLLIGDVEFDSPKTLAAFALALVLFLIMLILTLIALRVVGRYKEDAT